MSGPDIHEVTKDSVPPLQADVVRHLEFLGYAVSDRDARWISFTHASPRRWNVWLSFHEDQVVLSATVRVGAAIPARHRAVQEALNNLNKLSTAVRYVFVKRENEWVVRMIMHLPPRYQREEFGANIAIWEDETDQIKEVGDAYHGDGGDGSG